MSEEKSGKENWGFFESVLKIGFGVAFGFLVYDTLVPMADAISAFFADIGNWGSWWLKILMYPAMGLVLISMIILFPFLILIPFFILNNKISRGGFLVYPASWYEGDKEYLSFLVVWIYGFWALLFKFGVIG